MNASTTLVTGHDGEAQITFVVHGGGVTTITMTRETFLRHAAQVAAIMADMSRTGQGEKQGHLRP
jgi:hypothetical protein